MTISEEIQALETKLAATTGAREQAEVVLEILSQHVRMRSPEGQDFVDRLKTIAEELGSDHYLATAIYHQSMAARFGGDFAAALEFSAQAREIYLRDHDRMGQANCYNSDGNVYQQQGNFAEALRSHLEALRIREEIGHQVGVATSRGNISIVYYSMGNMTESLRHSNISLQMMLEMGNTYGAANAYTNIGNAHLGRKDYEEALRNYGLWQEIEMRAGNEYGIAASKCNIGNIYRLQGRYDEAMKELVPALGLFRSAGSKDGQVLVLNNIGAIDLAKGDYAQALSHYLLSEELCGEMGNKEELTEVYEGLMHSYRALGDHERALTYYDLFYQADKEKLGQETQRQIIQMTFRHEIELKERESQLLKEKNEVISLYAHKLEVSNNELKQFANVASHDLREPLRMVSSYMNLLEKTMGDKIEPVQKQFIGFAVDGAKRMEQLIHDLLRLAKVDANPQIERVPLPMIVAEVRSNLEILLAEKNAQIISSPLPDIMADRTQVMQLFQNIIGNGIKYNENPQPTITIDYQVRDADALLSIADNGIGIPADYREKAFQIFQRVPTAKQYQGTGIGLAICKKIVDGLGGTIAIDDNPGGGTVFYITMPLSVVVQ